MELCNEAVVSIISTCLYECLHFTSERRNSGGAPAPPSSSSPVCVCVYYICCVDFEKSFLMGENAHKLYMHAHNNTDVDTYAKYAHERAGARAHKRRQAEKFTRKKRENKVKRVK